MSISSKDTNHLNRPNWEQSDFPIVCETCLGPNPYIRMTKESYGSACKVCERPFTVFRWNPGKDARFKKTEICQTCSKIKNVCQTCLLDLEYGVPTQLRDKLLGKDDALPTSDVNKEYYIQNQEKAMAQQDGLNAYGKLAGSDASTSGGKMAAGRAILEKLKARGPYYKRNQAKICSFFVKGQCTRGDTCPYRHEMPTDPNDPLAKQNMIDRYYGKSDPVADKYIKQLANAPKLKPPEDPDVKTLYIGGVKPEFDITEADLREYFAPYGELSRVSFAPRQNAAFVDFVHRDEAERAVEVAHQSCVIKDNALRVLWGRSKKPQQASTEGQAMVPPLPGLPGAVPLPPGFGVRPPPGTAMLPPGLGVAPPPGAGSRSKTLYPSMDPSRIGSKAPQLEH